MMDETHIAFQILHALNDWQREHHRIFDGTLQVAVDDAQSIDEESQRNRYGEFFIPSTVRVGDTFFLWGVAGRAEDWTAGTFALENKHATH